MLAAAHDIASAQAACFHCGLPIAPEALQTAVVNGRLREFCCTGCATVCQTIHEAGLANFYQKLQRAELAPPPEAARNLDQYDLPDIQAEFVTAVGNRSEAMLLIEGIHCAACVWLIEKALAGLNGVEQAEVNLAHRRLRLRWDRRAIKLSAILHRLAAVGYAGVPYDPQRAEGVEGRRNRAMLYRMAFAAFGVANMMWIAISLYAGQLSGTMDPEHKQFLHWVAMALATPVLAYAGWPFLTAAVRGLRIGHLSMDLPISIGVAATYSYSIWVTVSGAGEVYFDVVTTFLFIILVGRYLESLSRRNAASASMRLMELQPRSALRLENGEPQLVSVRALALGDRVLIRPGDKVPVDGRVVEGSSEVDEALLTGESRPVTKEPGTTVVAGSVNGQGSLVVAVEQIGKNTALARIVHLVEAAQGSKAAIQGLADRIVPWFVLATLSLATLTFVYWYIQGNFDSALLAAVSVLIITCPCAFGMATPMSVTVAVGHAARNGVLVRNGRVLESVAAVSHVVLDKTGTLTEGRMAVAAVHAEPDCAGGSAQVLHLAAAVEAHSEHPIAKAIVAHARAQEILRTGRLDRFTAIPGRGVVATLGGEQILVGSRALLRDYGIELPKTLAGRGDEAEQAMGLPVYVAADNRALGVIIVEDRLRDEAAAAVQALRARGIGVTLLTGDSRAAAEHVASQLGTEVRVIAEVLPEDKEKVIAELQAAGECVMMVGDGINDAPALARADVGVAMGSGTDVSVECADVVLMGNDLHRLDFVLGLSRLTLRTIRQNIRLSLAYNALLIPLAMAAKLTPVFAAIAMPISSLLVIGNAILIRRRCGTLK